ncbi:phage holin family protein [Streptomyces sp. NPDC041068]|uniref:phage holin family protein n=1 Tax=Streptomyces sp. NPDC041068 TaxID=3155130 RepID=UPI0033CDF1D2
MTGPENPLTGLDKSLTDELVRAIRAELREELREQTKRQRRKATLYAASGAAALYAGAAVALALGLALALGMPDWAAALVVAVLFGVAALLLRNAARPRGARDFAVRTDTAMQSDPSGMGLGVPAPPPMPPASPGSKES